MSILNKIYISNATYIFLLISLFAGYFEYMFILIIFILIHEFGHLITASILDFEVDKIYLYPFGGIIKFNNMINTKINKELLVAIGGPLIQIFFYLLLYLLFYKGYINEQTFNKIYLINFSLLSFNLLPIIPLDGSKILSLILYKKINYKVADKIIIVISIILVFLISIIEKKVFPFLLLLLLLKNIYYEMINLKYKYNRFLLERYLYNIKFKNCKKIKNINKMYKDRYHYIKYEKKYITEKEYLSKMFDLSTHLW